MATIADLLTQDANLKDRPLDDEDPPSQRRDEHRRRLPKEIGATIERRLGAKVDPEDFKAQQDATGVAQPGVVPTEREDGPLGKILEFLGERLGQLRSAGENVQSGPGILGILDPSGGGAATASLALFGRGPGRRAVSNVADDPAFLQKVTEGLGADELFDILQKSSTDDAIHAGAARAEMIRELAEATPMGASRGQLRGAQEAVQDRQGRMILEALRRRGFGTAPTAQHAADQAAIETLLEQTRGFTP